MSRIRMDRDVEIALRDRAAAKAFNHIIDTYAPESKERAMREFEDLLAHYYQVLELQWVIEHGAPPQTVQPSPLARGICPPLREFEQAFKAVFGTRTKK